MSLLNHNTYMQFWRDAAAAYTPIAHDEHNVAFVRVVDSGRSPFTPYYYAQEFFENERDDLQFPCLIVESSQERYDYKSGIFATMKCGIVVLDASLEQNDFESQHNAVDSCKTHIGQLVSHLRKYLHDNPEMGILRVDSIMTHPIGPVKDGLFGYRAEFELKVSATSLFCNNSILWDV